MKLYNFLLAFFGGLIQILYKVKFTGNRHIDSDKAYIVASNHTHYFDPIVLAMAIKGNQIHFLAKKELMKLGFFEKIFRTIGVIPVDREKNDITAIKEVLKLLKNKNILGIFPQGTRIKDLEDDRSKAGLGMFAAKTGAEIIPVTIKSSYKPFSRIDVYFHDKYIPSQELIALGSNGYQKIAEEVMSIIKLGESDESSIS